MSKCACGVAAAAACCATGCLCQCLNVRLSRFHSRTRATTVRHRRDCFLEWKLRLLPLLHSAVLAAVLARCNDTTWTNRRRRRRRHGLPRRRRLFVLDACVRASELVRVRPSIHGPIIALHSAFASSLSPLASRKAALPINWCMTIVTAP